jgi:hypothetical protein
MKTRRLTKAHDVFALSLQTIHLEVVRPLEDLPSDDDNEMAGMTSSRR